MESPRPNLAERDRRFALGESWCRECRRFLPVGAFPKFKGNKRRGLAYTCSACGKAYRDTHREEVRAYFRRKYAEDRERKLAYAAGYRERNRALLREKANARQRDQSVHISGQQHRRWAAKRLVWITEAGGACQRCGYSEFIAAFEFHHIDATTKQDDPARVISSGDSERIRRELDGCVLLCANCHAGVHGRGWAGTWRKRDGLGWTCDDRNARASNAKALSLSGLAETGAGATTTRPRPIAD